MKHFQAAAIALGSVLVASSLIIGRFQLIAAVVPLTLFALTWGLLSRAVVPWILPNEPVVATRLIGVEWIGWVGLGSLAGGLPLWLASLLPDDASGSNEAGLTVVAVVGGLALIEVLKKLTVDDDVIEKAAQRRWKAAFTTSYGPLLRDGRLPAERVVDGVTTRSIAWQAVYLPPVHGGYGRAARRARAEDLHAALQPTTPDPSTTAASAASD